MSVTAREIASQPDLWRRVVDDLPELAGPLPTSGARVAVVGCGTSLYMAQSWAALREAAGHGHTDAFAASEPPPGRRYDVLVAITRSGTTTEVARLLADAPADRTVAITAVPDGPVGRIAGTVLPLPFADEESVVQTRFATTTLALLRAYLGAGDAVRAAADEAAGILAGELPVDPAGFGQWTFLGRGWTVGLAREAGLKLQEAAQAWTQAYPALEYRHGPISTSGPDSVLWSMGPLDAALAADVQATGATVVAPPVDPLAALVLVQRCAVTLAQARGLDPDRPRHLTRAVHLTD